MGTAGPKIVVIGGGVGGLTAALALRQAGIDVTVYERAPDERQILIGAGTHLWSNAMRVFRHLGVADQIEAGGSRVEHTEFRTAGGKLLADWTMGELGRKLQIPSIGVIRAELQRVLFDALGQEGVRFGARCIGFQQDVSGVTARFADGREERGDILIGADGIDSAVRAGLLGESKAPYAGWTYWQGVNTAQPDLCPDGIHRIVMGRGAKFIYHHGGAGRLCWLAMACAPATGGEDPPSGRKAAVLTTFRGWMEPIEQIVDSTDPQAIRHQDMYHRRPIKRWSDGRVTILGDAAHAMTSHVGQGMCQAIEDAYVLAKCLSTQSDPTEALQSYERERMGRTTSVSNLALRIGAMQGWSNPVLCVARDRIMKIMFNSVANKQNTEFVSYAV